METKSDNLSRMLKNLYDFQYVCNVLYFIKREKLYLPFKHVLACAHHGLWRVIDHVVEITGSAKVAKNVIDAIFSILEIWIREASEYLFKWNRYNSYMVRVEVLSQ